MALEESSPLQQTRFNDWHNIYMELALLIGKENAFIVYSHYKGTYVNFPMRLLSKEGLKNVVHSEYNGSNSKNIAKKYGYSIRHINRILQDKNQ